MTKEKNLINGWVILDKPSGITSAHAVAKVKRLLKPAKIGHAGTLDPLASGVLPLALGEATKTIQYMMDAAKAYSFTVTWGEERDTDDVEGKPTASSPKRPTEEEIEAILPEFTGHIQQTPPSYSAIKVDGERAYDLARGGEAVELKAREVRVDSLEIIKHHTDVTSFICHCGKGTYIRSLARDMGRKLGCFGHISVLRRLKVGKFSETHAISLEVLGEMVHKGALGFLQPVTSVLDDILAVDITPAQAACLQRGQTVLLPIQADTLTARCEGKLIAICEARDGIVKPVRVFNL
jgi:tRNA pseudouridine55 synthase